MNRRIQGCGIAKDDEAQALTEFAIVIPVVLLFFFAMLQYFSIVQASQLGNYAAYVAARSYAVHASVDGEDQATQTATKAAAMALAPIARLVPGEAFGLPIGSLSNLLPDWMPGQQLAEIGEGYLVAQYIRLNSSIGGGSITFTNGGSPRQVDVAINYPQPIYLPGLAELWDFVTGERIYHSLQPLSQGLTGLPGWSMPVYSYFDQAIELSPQQEGAPLGYYLTFPYVNIQSKCSIGYEDWGNKDGQSYSQYRPRQPDTVESDNTLDSQTQQQLNNLNELKQAEQDYTHAMNNQLNACKAWQTAQTKLSQAEANRNQVYANPNSTAAEKKQADAEVAQAQQAEQSAQATFDNANASLEQEQNTLENLQESVSGSSVDYGDPPPCNP